MIDDNPDAEGGQLEGSVDEQAAAELLEVPPEQLAAMVDQGLLTAEESSEGRRFSVAEVLAVRQQGG